MDGWMDGWMDDRKLAYSRTQESSIWELRTHSRDANVFIIYLYIATFLLPATGLTHGSLTEAWPLSLSEEHACQFIPQRQPVP